MPPNDLSKLPVIFINGFGKKPKKTKKVEQNATNE